MEELLALLKRKQMSIGSCESLTAGMFCEQLAAIPGASAVLKGGIISYQSIVKETLVGVDTQVIAQYGVISEECAMQMAEKTRVLLDCDLCVSFSGNAGPDAMEDKPAGFVCCAIALKNQVVPYHFQFVGSRNEVRQQVVDAMVTEIINIIHKM